MALRQSLAHHPQGQGKAGRRTGSVPACPPDCLPTLGQPEPVCCLTFQVAFPAMVRHVACMHAPAHPAPPRPFAACGEPKEALQKAGAVRA